MQFNKNLNKIRVFTNDMCELDKCHNSRARQLIKKKEAEVYVYENEKCLKLFKNKIDLNIERDIS